jgi:hypothetical protein
VALVPRSATFCPAIVAVHGPSMVAPAAGTNARQLASTNHERRPRRATVAQL